MLASELPLLALTGSAAGYVLAAGSLLDRQSANLALPSAAPLLLFRYCGSVVLA